MTRPHLLPGSRVYLDTNLFEGVEPYRQLMAELSTEIDRRDIAVIASELIFTELLLRPVREGRRERVADYLQLVQRTPRITLVPVDRRVILRSVHVRADFGLRSMDALHVATAIVHGCETFLTNDERLRAGGQIEVLTLLRAGRGPSRQGLSRPCEATKGGPAGSRHPRTRVEPVPGGQDHPAIANVVSEIAA